MERQRFGVWNRLVTAWRGAAHERTLGNLARSRRRSCGSRPEAIVCGEMPSLQAHVNRFLPHGDPRQARVTALTTKAETRN